ncbi:PAS domain-containing transcriptional regulator [Azospirillum sp. YIM B02556]|uniref:PAS domain-containing transcriptional regulator n=1 Tax=Azospirillum endophyticum TaxID=2800326 RepID=A0ABS1EZ65_9PROT|nr:PAS domain-containing transcriptional regulator [Azospirillum endophyticum]MBK1836440.1 PAS domain-containing transcriptional regulator [Azospirillum endophyticum]
MDYALQNMDVGLVLLDGARRVLALNPAAVRLLGERAAGLVGASLHDLHPPSHRAKVELLMAAAIDPAAPASACSMMVALPGRVLVVKATALSPAAAAAEGSAVTALMLMEAARPAAADAQASAPQSPASQPPKSLAEPLVKLPVEKGQGIVLLDPADAVYLQADGHYTTVHTAEGAFFCGLPLSELEARLDARSFVRTHRGYIVNLRHARAVERQDGRAAFVMAAPGAPRVPVSRNRADALKKRLAL